MAAPIRLANGTLLINPATPVKDTNSGIPLEGRGHGLVEGVGGICYKAPPPLTPAANDVFTEEELDARIDAIKARISAELARGVEPLLVHKHGEKPAQNAYAKPGLPMRRKWDDLRMVNCAGCQALLLGESEELLRALCVRKGYIAAKRLPPPVARRIQGRPACARCAASSPEKG